MECGSGDVVCQLGGWLSENEFVAAGLVEAISRIGQGANGVLGVIVELVRNYGQTIVGLIGFSFGFWRWWRYREHILHKRLAEFLSESDARLRDGHAQILQTIQRPAPGVSPKEPLFINKELRSVLRERRWDQTILAMNIESSADWQLTSAIESISRHLQMVGQAAFSLNQQLSAAYSLMGAIAASKADRASAGRSQDGPHALNFFRSALNVPGYGRNVFLKELEAHQLRKLGYLQHAEEAYREVLALAEAMEHTRERSILISRAKRNLAELWWRSAPLNAFNILTARAPGTPFYPGALSVIIKCEPLVDWERLEKAEMHYLTAILAKRLNFGGVEGNHLKEADVAYEALLLDLPKRRWFQPRTFVRLRERAIKGRERVFKRRKTDATTRIGCLDA